MVKTVNLNGLRSIIKHNVVKALKARSTNNNIIKYAIDTINNMNYDELKQKGITQKIINELNKKPKRQPKKILGGMKRKDRDDDEEQPQRSFFYEKL